MMGRINKVIQYREMLIVLVQKELKTKYKGSVLGFFWNILNPLLMMLVYTIVFQYIVGRGGLHHYSIYLLCGLLPWTWHANAVMSGTNSIAMNGHLINKIYFPIEILPFVMVFANLIHYLFGMGLLFIFLPFFHYGFHWGFLWIPVLCIIQGLLISGIILFLSPLNVFYRDVQNILNVVIPMWFFLTPIIYPLSFIPWKYAGLISLNPMAEIIGSYQKIIYYQVSPSFLHEILPSFLFSLGIFILGYMAFNHWRSRLPEEV